MTMRERLARWKLWLGFGSRATLTGPCVCPERCGRHPNLYELFFSPEATGGRVPDQVTYHGPGAWTDATGWTPLDTDRPARHWHPGPDGWTPQETDWFNRHMAPGSWPEHHSCARPYDWKRDGL